MSNIPEHKQGCDALGGYGHGVGQCTCGAVAPAVQAERTPQDYAIEHAGYMADAARRFMQSLDAVFDASEALEAAEAVDAEDATQKADDLNAAEESASEARSTLRNCIYEFEKRRDRAAATPPAQGKEGAIPALDAAIDAAMSSSPEGEKKGGAHA